MKKIISIILVILLISGCFYFAVNVHAAFLKTGDYITFGKYPQSLVTDENTISKLNLIDKDFSKFNYESAVMYYKDVELNGVKYRGIKMDHERYLLSYTVDDRGYERGKTYWFEYEDIRWRILNADKGIIISDLVIDNQPFCEKIYQKEEYDDSKFNHPFNCYGDPEFQFYANNYEHSTLRKWLNNDFYNTALIESEKGSVISTEVDNTACIEEFNSNNTVDKVYLLSYFELSDEDTFNMSINYDYLKNGNISDYAIIQGADVRHFQFYKNMYDYNHYDNRKNYCNQWLRTAGADMSQWSSFMYYEGRPMNILYLQVDQAAGVRPVMTVNLDAVTKDLCNHEYELNTVNPTCTVDGHVYAVCSECGSKYSYLLTSPLHDPIYFTTATCTEAGFGGGVRCNVCDYYAEPTYEEEALGHIDVNIDKICDRCGDYLGGDGENTTETGSCGERAEYVYDTTSHTLTIFGEGKIDIGAFSGRTDIENVIIKKGITQIGDNAFFDCTGIMSVYMDDTVEVIGNQAFSGCTSLYELNISKGVTSIGGYAFEDCSSLESLIIPETTTIIGDNAFIGCHKLKTISLPDSLTHIGMYTFFDCDVLEATIGTSEYVHNYVIENSIEHHIRHIPKDSETDYEYDYDCDLKCNKHNDVQTKDYEPTCTEPGFKGGSGCVCCDTIFVEPQYIPPKGHTIVIDKAIPATCTVSGATEGQHCSVCVEVIIEQQIIYPKGHSDLNDDGLCDNCGQKINGDEEITVNPIKNFFKRLATMFDKLFALFKKIFG